VVRAPAGREQERERDPRGHSAGTASHDRRIGHR
jgi:hypothetical protein